MNKLKSLYFHLIGNHPGIYTEMDLDTDIFLLDGGNMLLKFVRKSPTTFQLEELLPADYQHTHRVISSAGSSSSASIIDFLFSGVKSD